MLGNGLLLSSGGAVSYTTLNPSDTSGSITLSNGNLTATATANSQGVRSVKGESSGKWYFEAKRTSGPGVFGVGISTAGSNLTTSAAAGALLLNSNGGGYNDTTFFSAPTIANNDVISAVWDATAKTVQFYKNGSSTSIALQTYTFSNPTFARVTFAVANGSVVVFNFGATTFAYPSIASSNGCNNGVY